MYHFFDNSTVASIIAVITGSFVAIYQYKKQKNIDAIEKISAKVFLLKEKIHRVSFIRDRCFNTYQKLQEKKIENWKEKFDYGLSQELPKLSNILNEEIPILDQKIAMLLELYFSRNEKVLLAYKEFQDKLRKWNNFAINRPFEDSDFFKKPARDLPQLDIKELDELMNKIIKEL